MINFRQHSVLLTVLVRFALLTVLLCCFSAEHSVASAIDPQKESPLALHTSSIQTTPKPPMLRRLDSIEALVYDAASHHTETPATVSLLNKLAYEYFTRRPDKGMMFAWQAYTTAERLGDTLGLIDALNSIGIVHRFRDVYDSALVYHQRALTLAEQTGHAQSIAEAFYHIGNVYVSRSDYAHASDYHLRALHIFEQNGNEHWQAKVLMTIGGIVQRNEENYAQALEYQLRALHIRERIHDEPKMLAMSLYNIASVYKAIEKHKEAIEHYSRALAICRELADNHGIAICLGGLGAAYQLQGEYDKAYLYQFQAAAIQEQLGDRRAVALLLNTIGIGYLRQKEYKKALEFGQKTLTIAQNIGAIGEERDAFHLIAEAFNGLNEPAKALDAYRTYTHLKDSLFSKENTRKITLWQNRYENEKRSNEITRLQHESELERVRADNLRAGFVVSLIAAGAIVLLLGNRYLLKRRSEKELRRANNQLLNQRLELEAQSQEIRRTNEHLLEANRLFEENNTKLKMLNTEKNEIISIVAHDLRNPLANIKVLSGMMKTAPETFAPDEVKSISEQIHTTTVRVITLVKNLLDIRALERGGVNFQWGEFRIAPVVEVAIASYLSAAEAKNITLALENNADTESLVYADRNATLQALDNLISNAVKYSFPHAAVRVAIYRQTSVPEYTARQAQKNIPTDEWVVVEVKDGGPGLTDNDKKYVFGKFTRLSAIPTGGEESIGLGLSIVKRMIEGMNGRVWCESEYGHGASFFVALPAFSLQGNG